MARIARANPGNPERGPLTALCMTCGEVHRPPMCAPLDDGMIPTDDRGRDLPARLQAYNDVARGD